MNVNFAPSLAAVLKHEGLASAPRGQSLIVLPRGCGVVFQDHSLTVQFHKHIVSAIAGLLVGRRPSAVTGFVISVHVDAIERRSLGAWPNIAIEGGEISGPFFAHSDPATTIVREFRVGLVKTSSFGVIPCTKFRRSPVSTRMAVREPDSTSCFPVKTSTTFGYAAAHVFKAKSRFVSAIAEKKPRSAPPHAPVPADGNQTPIALASNFNGRSHIVEHALFGRPTQECPL